MPSLLTEHVRDYPASPNSDGVVRELRHLLRQRIRGAGMFALPPALLGYPHVKDWKDRDAWEDVTADCYLFAIAGPIIALRRSLLPDRDVDPLVRENVKRFVAERQRDNNPIGYAAYQNVRQAVRRAEAGGLLRLQRTKGRPIAETRLHFGGEGEISVTRVREAVTDRLTREVGRRMSSTSLEAQRWLLELLGSLRGAGLLRWGDLVAEMERVARDAWPSRAPPPSATGAEVDEEGEVETVRLLPSGTEVQDRDSLEALLSRARREIRQGTQPAAIRERRVRVIDRIAQHASETEGQRLLQVELAEALEIHQVTLCRDLQVIEALLERVSREMV